MRKTSVPPKPHGGAGATAAGAAAARAAIKAGTAQSDPAFKSGYDAGWASTMKSEGYIQGSRQAGEKLKSKSLEPEPGKTRAGAARTTPMAQRMRANLAKIGMLDFVEKSEARRLLARRAGKRRP